MKTCIGPIDVATTETVVFLTRYLPDSAQVLEVGCGRGHVARTLNDRGYRVVGLDADSETVSQAQQLGAPVIQATWPEFESAPVDAIAFTRSLHHIEDLRLAVRKAHDTLKPGGLLLVEDFAFDAADPPTIEWFVRILRNELVNVNASEFLDELTTSNDLASTWLQHHAHDAHTVEAMQRSIAEHFTIEETSVTAYLYRYLIPALPATTKAATFLQNVLKDEDKRGQAKQIELIGRRIVGRAAG